MSSDLTPLQYSYLENPMDGGAWCTAVHGVARSRTQLSDFTFTFMHWRRKWQPTPVDHVLSELSTMPHLSWGTLHGMAHSFIELHKAVIHVIILLSVIMVFVLEAVGL